MDNKFDAVMEFIKKFSGAGRSIYFNFVNSTDSESNTALIPVQYGQIVKKYVDGEVLLKTQYEIRQVKPLSTESNTTQNTEQIKLVQKFLDWINEQGEKENYPDFGESCTVLKLSVTEGVIMPNLVGVTQDGNALYGFPFEIIYKKRR